MELGAQPAKPGKWGSQFPFANSALLKEVNNSKPSLRKVQGAVLEMTVTFEGRG